jgi:S-adenosylmethionine:tRNA ribosyltransferase-isomerase
LHRNTGKLEHRTFREVGEYLHPGDLLVLNRTRVIPARLFARKPTGGRVEILLLHRENLLTWECLVGGKGLSVGKQIIVESDDSCRREITGFPKSEDFGLRAEIVEVLDGSRRRICFAEPIEPFLPKVGHVPLPPYIHETLKDPERYQTVYAREPGSAAAPTAGLHFTPRLLDELQAQDVHLAYVTLHVGLDTFAPVTEDNPTEHRIHTEWCELPQDTTDAINRTHRSGGRIIAVGTTSVRTLESAAHHSFIDDKRSAIQSFAGSTSLYILPGFRFRLVDALITNFHLPRSTLIMLVSAFAGRETILNVYEIAKQEGYRFYSFGDAMLIL